MKLNKILTSAILLSSTTAQDKSYNPTLSSCKDFAGQFQNTCDINSAAGDLASLTPAIKKCPKCTGNTVCSVENAQNGNECDNPRKLCITCREDAGQVYVRAQTNNIPSHCVCNPNGNIKETSYDWEVKWMMDVTKASTGRRLEDKPPKGGPPPKKDGGGPGGDTSAGLSTDKDQSSLDFCSADGKYCDAWKNMHSYPVTQAETNALICNIMRSKSDLVPDQVGLTFQAGQQESNTGWGVGISGGMLFNGISGEGVDPYFPTDYMGAGTEPERVDGCLGHPQNTGVFHYHTASPCFADETLTGEKNKDANVNDEILKGYKKKPYREVMGLSKDGRPIYSPVYGNGKTYDSCDVDVCNGLWIDGHYSYVATMFHPFIIGCYGPGGNATFSQECSSKPRACNVQGAGASGSSFLHVPHQLWSMMVAMTLLSTIINVY